MTRTRMLLGFVFTAAVKKKNKSINNECIRKSWKTWPSILLLIYCILSNCLLIKVSKNKTF